MHSEQTTDVTQRELLPRCAIGVYCTLAGSLMLVAPHRLMAAFVLQVDTSLAWWGTLYLLAGFGVLISTVAVTGMGVDMRPQAVQRRSL